MAEYDVNTQLLQRVNVLVEKVDRGLVEVSSG